MSFWRCLSAGIPAGFRVESGDWGRKEGGGKERRGVDGLTDAVDECGVHRSAETSAGSQLAGREAVDG